MVHGGRHRHGLLGRIEGAHRLRQLHHGHLVLVHMAVLEVERGRQIDASARLHLLNVGRHDFLYI